MTILDISGSQGNAYCLLGHSRQFSRVMGLDWKSIEGEMTSGDYDHLVETFEKYFSDVCTLVNKLF